MIALAGLLRAAIAAMTLAGAACASAAREPATLAARDAQTLAALKSALGEALGRARIELGPIDDGGGTVAVLPPPMGSNEDRSTATPIIFDLFVADGRCVARRRDTADGDVSLPGVACRPLSD